MYDGWLAGNCPGYSFGYSETTGFGCWKILGNAADIPSYDERYIKCSCYYATCFDTCVDKYAIYESCLNGCSSGHTYPNPSDYDMNTDEGQNNYWNAYMNVEMAIMECQWTNCHAPYSTAEEQQQGF